MSSGITQPSMVSHFSFVARIAGKASIDRITSIGISENSTKHKTIATAPDRHAPARSHVYMETYPNHRPRIIDSGICSQYLSRRDIDFFIGLRNRLIDQVPCGQWPKYHRRTAESSTMLFPQPSPLLDPLPCRLRKPPPPYWYRKRTSPRYRPRRLLCNHPSKLWLPSDQGLVLIASQAQSGA